MKFTDLFIRRPVLAIVVNLVILIAGIRAIRSLSVRQYPRSDNAVVNVFVRDIDAASNALVSRATGPGGAPGGDNSANADISPSGDIALKAGAVAYIWPRTDPTVEATFAAHPAAPCQAARCLAEPFLEEQSLGEPFRAGPSQAAPCLAARWPAARYNT